MELFPMKVHAVEHETVSFVCAYFSTEKLDIELEVMSKPGSSAQIVSPSPYKDLRPTIKDSLIQFPWGGRRTLLLEVNKHHDRVKCRVTSNGDDKQILGELTSHIYLKSSG